MPSYKVILFDLLSALVDSWSLWDAVAGDPKVGRRWRMRYLDIASHTAGYRPYLDLVAEAALGAGMPRSRAEDLASRWSELAPWPETVPLLAELASTARLGVITNCSEELGQACARRVWPHLEVVVSAEQAGCYKPQARIYQLAIEAMGVPAGQILFVAGSPYDVLGASNAGLPVCWHNRLDLQDEHARAAALGSFYNLNKLHDWIA